MLSEGGQLARLAVGRADVAALAGRRVRHHRPRLSALCIEGVPALRAGIAGVLALELQQEWPRPVRCASVLCTPSPPQGRPSLEAKGRAARSPRRGFPLKKPPSGRPPESIVLKGATPPSLGFCSLSLAVPWGPLGGLRAGPMTGPGLRLAPFALKSEFTASTRPAPSGPLQGASPARAPERALAGTCCPPAAAGSRAECG